MDVGLFIVNDCIELKLEKGELGEDRTLETAVLISLFTDARVSDLELPQGVDDKRGFWADALTENDNTGSKIWALSRSKQTPESLALLETYAKDSLEWMIEDGVASGVSVIAEYDELNRAVATIQITRPRGETSRFSLVWDEQELLRA